MCGLNFGGVPKWSTGADCKSAGDAFVGSNPTPSTIDDVGRCRVGFNRLLVTGTEKRGYWEAGGCSSMVEPQPSKLMVWVRFPSPAPGVSGSKKDRLDSRATWVFQPYTIIIAISPYSSVGR